MDTNTQSHKSLAKAEKWLEKLDFRVGNNGEIEEIPGASSVQFHTEDGANSIDI